MNREEAKTVAIRMREAGATWGAISAALDRDIKTLRRWVKPHVAARDNERRRALRGSAKEKKPVDLDVAERMRSEGLTWNEIGRHFGVTPDAVRRHLDPFWAEKRREQINRNRSVNVTAEDVSPAKMFGVGECVQTRRNAELLMTRIPKDTRDLTARLCGDPLPGRSALARRQQEAAE